MGVELNLVLYGTDWKSSTTVKAIGNVVFFSIHFNKILLVCEYAFPGIIYSIYFIA